MDGRLGLWFPALRFGIRQGHEGSVRVIDDFSGAGHNGATSISEEVDVGGDDVVVGVSRCLFSADAASMFSLLPSNAQWCHRRVLPKLQQQDLQVKGGTCVSC